MRSRHIDTNWVSGLSNRPGPVKVDKVNRNVTRCKRLDVNKKVDIPSVPPRAAFARCSPCVVPGLLLLRIREVLTIKYGVLGPIHDHCNPLGRDLNALPGRRHETVGREVLVRVALCT